MARILVFSAFKLKGHRQDGRKAGLDETIREREAVRGNQCLRRLGRLQDAQQLPSLRFPHPNLSAGIEGSTDEETPVGGKGEPADFTLILFKRVEGHRRAAVPREHP